MGLKVKIEREYELDEVETPYGKLYMTRYGDLVLRHDDFKIQVRQKGEEFEVYIDVKHRRVGHDHNDWIYVRVAGIPAETHEPCVYTGRGDYKVVRVTKVKVMGDLVEVEKVGEGDWKRFSG